MVDLHPEGGSPWHGHGSAGLSAAGFLDGGEASQVAALRTDMDEKTARKYRDLGKLPSELEPWPRTWRTRRGSLRGRLGGGARETRDQSRLAGQHLVRLAPTALSRPVFQWSVADPSTSDSSLAGGGGAAQGGVLRADPLSRPAGCVRLHSHDEPGRHPGGQPFDHMVLSLRAHLLELGDRPRSASPRASRASARGCSRRCGNWEGCPSAIARIA